MSCLTESPCIRLYLQIYYLTSLNSVIAMYSTLRMVWYCILAKINFQNKINRRDQIKDFFLNLTELKAERKKMCREDS
jgi:hypothetical protein